MNNDDDLFVVIVGDEHESEPKWEFEHNIEIKQEVLDEDEVQIKIEEHLDKATEDKVLELDDENFEIYNNEFNDSQNKFKSQYEEDDCLNLEGNEDYVPSELGEMDSDEDYVPSDHSIDEISYTSGTNNSDAEYSSKNSKANSKSKKKKGLHKIFNHSTGKTERKKTHFWKGREREIISHVKYLRFKYPDLKNDNENLINYLVKVMKQTRPPDPPADYYVMNGIMLECIHCGSKSTTIPAAHRHYQERHGERYLYCFACGADFRSTKNLYKHEKRCDAPDIEIVLKARARSVGRKGRSRPFLSEIPPKYFDKPIRQYKCTNIRQYKCTECSASFLYKESLQCHQRMHRGERPFICHYCPCSYTSKAALNRHIQKHGSQEYICDHCQRSFKIKDALAQHLRTHAPLKKFPCAECPKRYSMKSALLLHVNRDHRKLPLPFGCQICPMRYPRMSVLKDHMRKVHGMLIITGKTFAKQLPVLTDTQLQQAKVVLKTNKHPPPDIEDQ